MFKYCIYLNHLYFPLYTFRIDIDIHQILASKEQTETWLAEVRKGVYISVWNYANFLEFAFLCYHQTVTGHLFFLFVCTLFCFAYPTISFVRSHLSPSAVPWAAALRLTRDLWEKCLVWAPRGVHTCVRPRDFSSRPCTFSQNCQLT